MDLQSIFSLGSFGLNLFSNISKKNAYRAQENTYVQQAEINRKIGLLNAEVADRTGTETTYAIIRQTKKMLGSNIVAWGNRGVSLEGSPMLVLGEIATMGEAEAQNAYFNAQVQKINYQLNTSQVVNSAISGAEQAKYGAFSSMIQSAMSLKQGFDMVKSMMASSNLNNMNINTGNSTIASLKLGMMK